MRTGITSVIATTVIVSLVGVRSFAAVITGPVFSPVNGHKYYLLSQNTWTASETEAVSLGGHLATIRSQAEEDWAFSNFSTFGGVSRGLWIGLNDAATEGTYVWTSGEPITFTNYASSEPNGSTADSDYTIVYAPGVPPAGKWDDGQNLNFWGYGGTTFPMHGVVEVLPEPTSAAMLVMAVGLSTLCRRKRSPILCRNRLN